MRHQQACHTAFAWLFGAGLCLLSGAVATAAALWVARQLEFHNQG